MQELSDPNNYHEFCRLLARLKSNYQLGELVTVDNYQVNQSLEKVDEVWDGLALKKSTKIKSLLYCTNNLGNFFNDTVTKFNLFCSVTNNWMMVY